MTQRHGFGRFYPDYYLFDSLLYHDIVNAGYGSDRVVEMGNPKFDGIFENIQKKQIPEGWKKFLGGCKESNFMDDRSWCA